MIVLGCDPGKLKGSFAWATFGGRGHPHLLEAGLIDPIEDMKEESFFAFVGRMAILLSETKANAVCYERFIPRPGRGRGGTAERVIAMLALTWTTCMTAKPKPLPFLAVMPSTHKVWRTRTERDWLCLPSEHQRDAATIAAWAWYRLNMQ